MLKQMRTWWRDRGIHRDAQAIRRTGQGVSTMRAPCTPSMTGVQRQHLIDQIVPWVREQLALAPTPDGLTYYVLVAGFAAYTGQQRVPLTKQTFPIHERLAIPATVETLATHLVTTAIPAAATHLEIYVFSAGGALRALQHDGAAPH